MTEIKNLIHSLGIPSTYIGFHQLYHSVMIAAKNEDCLLSITKRLYPVVAAKFNTTGICVERNIRTVIEYFWNNGDHQRLDEIAGFHVAQKPTAGEFISMLSFYMNSNYSGKE